MHKRVFIGTSASITLLFCLLFSGANSTFAQDSTFLIDIYPSTTISLSSRAVRLHLTPTSNGNFNSASFDVSVSTNSSAGYIMSLGTSSSTLNSFTKDPNTDDYYTIESINNVTGGRTEEEFIQDSTTTNRWGVSIDNTLSYNPILTSKIIKNASGAIENDVTTVNAGAKINFETAPGIYSTTLNFSVVSKITDYYMQDIETWSSTLLVGNEVQAVDVRDGKKYWVSRLEDGQIWMTQNLDFNIDSTKTYTHYDTDLGWGNDGFNTNATWTPVNSTIFTTSNSISAWSNSATTPYSVDTGNWYFNPSLDDYGESNYLASGYSGGVFSQLPYAENGTHGHVGNYYNWSAAVASNDTSSFTNNSVTDPYEDELLGGIPHNSICPAGWRLPTDYDEAASASGSANEFAQLFYSQYNILSHTSYNQLSYRDVPTLGTRGAPLYLNEVGFISDTHLKNAGTNGYLWTSAVGGQTKAYYLQFRDGDSADEAGNFFVTAGSYNRYHGRSVRCVVREDSTANKNYFIMQNVMDWGDQLNSGDSVRAIDLRDNKSYWVTKMNDGSIWMTQNLDLDLDSTRVYTHYDTDLGWTTDDESVTWMPTNSTIDATSGTISGWVGSTTAPYSVNPSDRYYYTSGANSDDTTYDSLANCKRFHSEDDCLHYHNGNYYNWTAAVASNDSSNYATNGKVAEDSICPAGWRLPLGPTSDANYSAYVSSNYSEFSKLFYNYELIPSLDSNGDATTFIAIRNIPLYFVSSGYLGNSYSAVAGAAEYGRYWSSTAINNTDSRYLYFGRGFVYPQYYYNKGNGSSVRCVARDN